MNLRLASIGLVLLLGLAAPAVAQTVPPVTPQIAASLAPTGRLKVGINFGNVVIAQKDPTTGAPRGVAVDIAHELGRRLGVPVDVVVYDAAGAMVAAQARDGWDVAFLGAEPERMAVLDFTAPYVVIEGTYLVRDASAWRSVAELDRPGVRIAAGLNSAYDLYLSRNLKAAALQRAPTSSAAIALFQSENLDAAAGVREALVDAAKATPGLRVLGDSYMQIGQAVAVPKGRPVGQAYLAALIEALKADGFVRAALDRSGQTGALVGAPAKP
jgi:polar amino acid transport system substrate-binding protein